MLSIIIPSRTDIYLQKTINDLLEKALEDIEIIVVLDGYKPKDIEIIPEVNLYYKNHIGMRGCINYGMSLARGKYVMKLDEHCMVDEGFDVKLKEHCKENWVMIPRRHRLDADKWEIIEDGRPPIDYMYISLKDNALRGQIDSNRFYENAHYSIDDTMTSQGSCYFLHKSYWDKLLHPLDDMNYGPFANEAQEISNKVWLSGGEVKVNKLTWYAHWHRTSNLYNFTHEEQREFNESVKKGREYSIDFWLNNRWKDRLHDYNWLVDKFFPGVKVEYDNREWRYCPSITR